MVTMAQSALNWRNTYTQVDRTHSLTLTSTQLQPQDPMLFPDENMVRAVNMLSAKSCHTHTHSKCSSTFCLLIMVNTDVIQ